MTSKIEQAAREYADSDAAQVVARQYEIVDAPFLGQQKTFQAHLDGQRVGHFAGAKALLEWARSKGVWTVQIGDLEAYFAEQSK